MAKSKGKGTSEHTELSCAFCGKPERAAQRMIVLGKNKKPICDECIHICTQILDDAGVNNS